MEAVKCENGHTSAVDDAQPTPCDADRPLATHREFRNEFQRSKRELGSRGSFRRFAMLFAKAKNFSLSNFEASIAQELQGLRADVAIQRMICPVGHDLLSKRISEDLDGHELPPRRVRPIFQPLLVVTEVVRRGVEEGSNGTPPDERFAPIPIVPAGAYAVLERLQQSGQH